MVLSLAFHVLKVEFTVKCILAGYGCAPQPDFIFIKRGEEKMDNTKKVAVIMGSDSDFPVVKNAVKTLKAFKIPVELHVMSAHRTPEAAL